MIPATLLVTKLPAHIVLPLSTFSWGLFTMLAFWAKSFSQLAAYRFIIGLCEGPFFCSIHYVLGSWYRPDELVRRAGIFYMSSGAGTISTGVLAARIYQDLNGALGHAGWRWMFMIGALCTFPIAIWGAIFFPGALRDKKRWFMTQQEHEIALERMRLVGRSRPKGLPFAWSSLKRFFGRWHWWVLVPWNILWILGVGWWQQHILWLRAQPQYSIVQVNNYTVCTRCVYDFDILLIL
jgi:MFS family permease